MDIHNYKYKYYKYKRKYILAKIKDSIILTPDSIKIINYLDTLKFDFILKTQIVTLNRFSSIYNSISKKILIYPYQLDIKKNYFDTHTIFLDNRIKEDISNIGNLHKTLYKYNNMDIIIQTNQNPSNSTIRLFFCLLIMQNYTKDCIIGLYPSNMKKMLPNKTEPITPFNINSGFTYPYKYSIMFRKEEIIKVTIHELLHQIGVNLNIIIDKKSINNYFKYIKNDDILLDEAYVEFNACILNLLYIKELYNINDNMLNQLILYELKFSLLQLAKLLLHFNITDYNDFYPKCHLLNSNNNTNKNCICKIGNNYKVNIDQNHMCADITHPESYIIIKTAMLYYMDETLSILEKNGKNIFNPNNNALNEEEIVSYILDICGRNEFVNSVNETIQLYKSSNNKDDFINKTCRLSCIETFM